MKEARHSVRMGLAAAMSAGLVLTACGSDNGGSEDLEGQTINVLALQDPFFYAVEELLPQFEEETGIDVNLEGLDYETLNSRATNSFMADQGEIDVISPDSMWLSRYAEAGWLEPLNERIEEDNDEFQIEDFIPSSLHSLSQWGGEFYTVPVATYGTGVLYRPSVFEELGIEEPPSEPSDDWTWDRYMEVLEEIDGETVDGTEYHGTVVLGSGPEPITHMYSQIPASKGATWFEAFPDAEEWDFTPTFDSETSVESLQYYKDLYELSPAEAINYVWFDAGTRFGAGDISMMYHWTPYAYLVQRTDYMGTNESEIIDDYALAALPQEPGEEQVINIGGYSLGIAENSERQEAAWEFVKWVSSAETQKDMALLDMRQFADFSRASLYEDEELIEAYPFLPAQYEVIAQGDGKTVRPPTMNYATLEQSIGNSLNSMLVNDTPADEVAQTINSDLEQILEEEGLLPWPGESYNDTYEVTEQLISELAGG